MFGYKKPHFYTYFYDVFVVFFSINHCIMLTKVGKLTFSQFFRPTLSFWTFINVQIAFSYFRFGEILLLRI